MAGLNPFSLSIKSSSHKKVRAAFLCGGHKRLTTHAAPWLCLFFCARAPIPLFVWGDLKPEKVCAENMLTAFAKRNAQPLCGRPLPGTNKKGTAIHSRPFFTRISLYSSALSILLLRPWTIFVRNPGRGTPVSPIFSRMEMTSFTMSHTAVRD